MGNLSYSVCMVSTSSSLIDKYDKNEIRYIPYFIFIIQWMNK